MHVNVQNNHFQLWRPRQLHINTIWRWTVVHPGGRRLHSDRYCQLWIRMCHRLSWNIHQSWQVTNHSLRSLTKSMVLRYTDWINEIIEDREVTELVSTEMSSDPFYQMLLSDRNDSTMASPLAPLLMLIIILSHMIWKRYKIQMFNTKDLFTKIFCSIKTWI